MIQQETLNKSPERALWMAVIIRACLDASGNPSSTGLAQSDNTKRAAERWMVSPEAQFVGDIFNVNMKRLAKRVRSGGRLEAPKGRCYVSMLDYIYGDESDTIWDNPGKVYR